MYEPCQPRMFVAIVWIVLPFLANTLSLKQCDETTQTLKLPHIVYYDASEEEYTYYSNGSVTLNVPKEAGSAIGWIGLSCEHSNAVRFIHNRDPEHLQTTNSVTRRNFTDFHNVSTYQFIAETEVQVLRSDEEFVFACVSFENPCERKFVKVYQNDDENYVITSITKDEESQPPVQELARHFTLHSSPGVTNQDPCNNVTFLFQQSKDPRKHEFYHQFRPKGGVQETHLYLADRQEMENYYLYTEIIDKRCVRKCDDNCSTTQMENRGLQRPSVFYKNFGKNVSRVARTYSTLPSADFPKGKMKFLWEYSDPHDFLRMDEIPKYFYAGSPITINCRMATFLFSFGTRTGYSNNSQGDNIIFLPYNPDLYTGNELIDFEEARIQKTTFTLPTGEFSSRNFTVFCFAPIWNSSTEWVNTSRHFQIIDSTLSSLKEEKNQFEIPLKSYFNTSCDFSGVPLPDVNVDLPRNLTRIKKHYEDIQNMRRLVIIIDSLDETHVGVYNCTAHNPKGIVYQTFEIKSAGLTISDNSLSTVTISVISALSSICAIFIFISLALLVKLRVEKRQLKKLTDEAVREFMEGMDESRIPQTEDQPLLANDSIKALPYNKRFEVHHKHWSLGGTMLGAGAFGEVRKGSVRIGNRTSLIAIKTLKSTESIDDFKANLLELKILSTIGEHPHIVRLIAASTDEIHSRKVLIGVELCANGSLLSYLKKRKKLFTNLVKDGQIQFESDHSEKEISQNAEGTHDNLVVSSDISTIDLYKWSFQIASGMDFLESRKVLHADLAARNVLLTEQLLVKISDFGLSRELYENSEYVKKMQAVLLPFKWMAVESLKYLKFSIKSDVWSFGVTLYEVFTLGEEPYPGQTWNEEFVACMENGMRLERPPFATDNMYSTVMTQCWLSEPSERIRCADAMAFFEKAIGLLTSSPRNTDHCRDFC